MGTIGKPVFPKPAKRKHLARSYSLRLDMERLCRTPFRPIAEFATARLQGVDSLAVELHAIARPNGRILDGFQFRLGGPIFDVEVALDELLPYKQFRGWKVRFQQRPADVLLRLNMTTSVWQCLPALVAMREAEVFDGTGSGIGPGEFVRMLDELEEDPDTAAFRWAVVINDAMGLNLQMQTLPGAATVLCGKPTLRK